MTKKIRIAKGARKAASPFARIEDALAAFRRGRRVGLRRGLGEGAVHGRDRSFGA